MTGQILTLSTYNFYEVSNILLLKTVPDTELLKSKHRKRIFEWYLHQRKFWCSYLVPNFVKTCPFRTKFFEIKRQMTSFVRRPISMF